MGFMDSIRNAAENMQAQQSAASAQALAAALPPGSVVPQRAMVRPSPRFGDATLQAFFATVGLAPEDCYGISSIQSNDVTIAWEVYFRYQPAHDAGFARWAEMGD